MVPNTQAIHCSLEPAIMTGLLLASSESSRLTERL